MILHGRFLQLTGGIKNQVHSAGFNYYQRRSLVNIKLKLVKDRVLDKVVRNRRKLRATCKLISMIASEPNHCISISRLTSHIWKLKMPHNDVKVATFMRLYPNIFEELSYRDSIGRPKPWFKLTPEVEKIKQEEDTVMQNCYVDALQRLQKFLMMTESRTLPIATIHHLKWDLGLPNDYSRSFIRSHPDLFSLVRLPDDRSGLKLLKWDPSLAVSHMEMSSVKEDRDPLAFPIKFTKGFGLKKKCMKWLDEWQKLPYTSPYVDASHLDRRTDVSEKRIVGVFHELLHLTVQKKTERRNVTSLQKPLALPQKFTKVFARHPGIFYTSRKGERFTIVLREAYDRDARLIETHPLAEIRDKYERLIRKGDVDRRKRGSSKDANEERRQNASGILTEKKMKVYESEEDSELDLSAGYVDRRKQGLYKDANEERRQNASGILTEKKMKVYESEEDSELDLPAGYESGETTDHSY